MFKSIDCIKFEKKAAEVALAKEKARRKAIRKFRRLIANYRHDRQIWLLNMAGWLDHVQR